ALFAIGVPSGLMLENHSFTAGPKADATSEGSGSRTVGSGADSLASASAAVHTPSARPTPLPAPARRAKCHGARNTPGGQDPWGGCWPGPYNTGVPRGTTLSAYHGPCTIKHRNFVIDAKVVNCALVILGGNTTIENSKVNGPVHNDGPGRLVIKHSVVD